MKHLANLTKNFTRLDNRILQDSSVSVECKGVYAYLVSLPNDWQFSLKNIAKALNIGEKKLSGIFKEMIGHRLLKKWYFNDARGFRRLELCLYDYTTCENPTMPNGEVGENITNKVKKAILTPKTNKILQCQMGDLDKTPLNANDCDIQNAKTALNASENPSMPKWDVGSILLYTNKELYLQKKNLNKKDKAIFEKQTFEIFLNYAKQKFENAKEKPKISLDLWLKWIESKDFALKKVKKELTAQAIDNDFNALFKLQEMRILSDRIAESIDKEWQGIWFASDSKEWQKRGGHFRNNVGHLDYDQSKNVDNPLRAIETHITI